MKLSVFKICKCYDLEIEAIYSCKVLIEKICSKKLKLKFSNDKSNCRCYSFCKKEFINLNLKKFGKQRKPFLYNLLKWKDT